MRFTRKTAVRVAAAAAIVAGGVGAVVLPAGASGGASGDPAVSFFSPPLFLEIEAQSPAHLVAKGAAVEVTVEFTCAGAVGSGSIGISVTQNVEGRVASGFTNTTVSCGPQNQTTVIRVSASAGEVAFQTGPAFAQSFISACTVDFCGTEQSDGKIRIRR